MSHLSAVIFNIIAYSYFQFLDLLSGPKLAGGPCKLGLENFSI